MPGAELTRELRRVQAVLGIADPNLIVVWSVEEAARRLSKCAAVIESPNLTAAACHMSEL